MHKQSTRTKRLKRGSNSRGRRRFRRRFGFTPISKGKPNDRKTRTS